MQSRNPICAHWSGVGRVDAPLSSAKNGRGQKAAPVFCFSPYAPCSAANGAGFRVLVALPRGTTAVVVGAEGYLDVFAQSMALAGGYDVIMLLVSWVLYDFVISA